MLQTSSTHSDRRKDWRNKLLKSTSFNSSFNDSVFSVSPSFSRSSSFLNTSPNSISQSLFDSRSSYSSGLMTPLTPQSQYTSVFSSSPGRSNNHRKHSLSSSSAKPFTILTPPPAASKNPLGLNTSPSSSKKYLSNSPKKPFSFRGKKIHSLSSTNANNSTSDLLTPLEPCDEPFSLLWLMTWKAQVHFLKSTLPKYPMIRLTLYYWHLSHQRGPKFSRLSSPILINQNAPRIIP